MRRFRPALISVRRDEASKSLMVTIRKKLNDDPKDARIFTEEKPASEDAIRSYGLSLNDKDIKFLVGKAPDGSEKYVRKRIHTAMSVGNLFLAGGILIGILVFAIGLKSFPQ
jgi:hypothetical protein